MNLNELLTELANQGVKLWIDGDQLKVRVPQGVLTPQQRTQLAERKAEILHLLRQRSQKPQMTELHPIPILRQDFFPLSFEQERLFGVAQLVSGNAVHNVLQLVKLSGHLDCAVLQDSLTVIVQRHTALRAIFPLVDGKPIQRIIPLSSLVDLPCVDLQRLTETDQKQAIEKIVQQEAKQPFDIGQKFLFRYQLLQLSQRSHILCLSFHHLIIDLISVDLFLQELVTHYEALIQGKPVPLPDLSMQYGDFAAWQQEWLQGEFFANQIAYWKTQLAEECPLIELSSDRPRPLLRSFQGVHYPFYLSVSLWTNLKHLSRQEGVTPFMLLLAAFKVLLHRYSGQTDIRLGSPTSGRIHSQLEPLIGFMAYPLVLRTDLSNNPTFRELLIRIRLVVVDAQTQQKIPFGKILEFLPPELRRQQNPFSVLFSLISRPMKSLSAGSLDFTPMKEFTQGTTDLDLLMSLCEVDDGLYGGLEYNTDLFEEATIHRMIGHFQTLLTGIVANPDQRIGELPLLTQAEQQLIQIEWNNTQRDYPQDKCLHQLWEEQAAKTPEAIAVVFEDQTLTYDQLNQKANQLAYFLQKLGVKPEVLVGICMERSLDMVVGLLGILKAGGAYVPIDPTYPAERLLYMLQDSQVPVLLTQEKLVTQLPEFQGKTLCLDREWEQIAQEKPENPLNDTQPDNLAYVIYTSGSTGKPKGAMNTHRGIVNRLLWMQDAYQLTPKDRVLQKTPFSFDVSVWEFFWPLLTGARLVVAQPGGHQDSGYLVKLIASEQITTVHFVPSMLQVFLEEPDLAKCQSLKRVICSGEALPRELTKRFFTRLGCELHNLYGPTEAAVDVTAWHCKPDDEQPIVPIGRPIANTQTYILDSYLQPVPIGMKGELHIGGVQLARGYHNRSELTAEKFIAHPFSKDAQARLYKTGDLARYLPDGNIEYLGRIDYQVKIRGFRIELGEIEAILTQHPQVREAVVIVWEDTAGVQRLVAYWVANQQQELDGKQLREFLQQKLPEYMIPSTFVQLETMPLSPNGKIDRRALPLPALDRSKQEVNFVLPRTQTEEVIAAIISDVLNLEQIGIYDNFFELGGNSLLATQVVSRLRQAFSVELSLRHLFESSTIAQLAEQIERLQKQTVLPSPIIPKLSRESRRLKRASLK